MFFSNFIKSAESLPSCKHHSCFYISFSADKTIFPSAFQRTNESFTQWIKFLMFFYFFLVFPGFSFFRLKENKSFCPSKTTPLSFSHTFFRLTKWQYYFCKTFFPSQRNKKAKTWRRKNFWIWFASRAYWRAKKIWYYYGNNDLVKWKMGETMSISK